jgi:hypothetical protein
MRATSPSNGSPQPGTPAFEVARLIEQLSPENSIEVRMVATHGLAGILATAHGKPEMTSLCLQQARYQSPIAGLLKLAADADDGGLSLKLVLSCLANLSFIGFTQDMAEEEELARMLAQTAVDSVQDDSLRAYSLPALYNMSSEANVLAALDSANAAPVLEKLASEESSADLKGYAKGTLKNLSKHHLAVEREQKRAARKGRKRGLRRGFKAKRGEALAQDRENAPPQDAASQEALSPQKHSPTSVMLGPKLTSGQPSHAKDRGLSVAIPTRKLGAVSRLGSVREPTPSRSSPGR